MNRLKEKVALVTGGASGIGRGIVDVFAAEGAAVAVLDIQSEWTRDTEKRLRDGGALVLGIHGDVTNSHNVRHAVERCVNEWGRLDVLVNNAGTSVKGAPNLSDLAESEWDRVMAVNVKGPLFGIQAATPIMKTAGGGSIINITSISARSCYPGRGPYSMSKAALENLTLQAAVELGPFKIRVNSISPGWFRTQRNESHYQAPGELQRRHAT